MKPSSQKTWLLGLLLLGLLMLAEPAFASDIMDSTMTKFEQATQKFGDNIKDIGVSLLWKLALIQFLVNGILMLLKKVEIEEILASVVRFMLTTGLFYGLMYFSSDYLPAIINSFDLIGQKGSGLAHLTPSVIIQQGVDLGDVMVSAFNKSTGADDGFFAALQNIGPAMTLMVICIITFMSFVVLAAQMALTMISSYLWLCITPLLLGFGGSQFTRDIAVNSLKGGIAIGMKYLTVYLIVGVAGTLAPVMGESMKDVTLTDWSPLYKSLGVSMILAYLSFQLPKVSADLMNGTASLSAGDAGTNIAMMAAGGVGATAALGGAAGAAMAAGKAGMGAASTTSSALGKALSGMMNSDFGSMRAAAPAMSGNGGSAASTAVTNPVMPPSSPSPAMSGSGESTASTSATNPVMPPPAPAPSENVASSGGAGSSSTVDSRSSAGGGSGSASNAGASTAPATATAPTSKGGAVPASSSAAPASSSAAPNMGTPVMPQSSNASLGDASTASISGGTPSGTNAGNSSGGSDSKSLHDRIQGLQGYVPQDGHTVGLSANISHAAGE